MVNAIVVTLTEPHRSPIKGTGRLRGLGVQVSFGTQLHMVPWEWLLHRLPFPSQKSKGADWWLCKDLFQRHKSWVQEPLMWADRPCWSLMKEVNLRSPPCPRWAKAVTQWSPPSPGPWTFRSLKLTLTARLSPGEVALPAGWGAACSPAVSSSMEPGTG